MKITTLFCTAIIFLNACSQKDIDSTSALKEATIRVDSTKLNDSLISASSPADNFKNSASADEGKEWLANIFKNNHSEKSFPDYDVEEKLCTSRFKDFIIDSNDIYGPSNLTEEELPAAQKAYEKKWAKIYPLYTTECFLFGRGNGDMGELKGLKIKKISPLKYSVFINYDGDYKTLNEVTLQPENGSYKIDYCKTEFL